MTPEVQIILQLLSAAARLYPDVARWLAAVADGDLKAVDEINRILPAESASAAFLREHGDQ